MALLKEVEDRSAVMAWSPLAARPQLFVCGTKDAGGVGFDDYGGDLELYSLALDEVGYSTAKLGAVKTGSRFASLSWANYTTMACGLVAGGMTDGCVNVWDPSRLLNEEAQCQVASVQPHAGAVTSVQFNPHPESTHVLASGGADGNVWITPFDNPSSATPLSPAAEVSQSRHAGPVNSVAWNTQVSHIVCTGSADGSSVIWDLRQKQPWCIIRGGAAVSEVCWNPENGQHLINASGDDQNPVVRLYDLRSSTDLPLSECRGHTQAILSLSWCPHDTSLIMTCGKDNKTLLWDLHLAVPVYELTSETASSSAPAEAKKDHADPVAEPTGAAGLFGASPGTSAFGAQSNFGSSNTTGRRYLARWSPRLPGVVATASFDRRLQFHNISSAKTSSGRAPRYFRRPAGVSWAFGGKLVSFGSASRNTASQVTISKVVEDPALVHASTTFQQIQSAAEAGPTAEAKQKYAEYCKGKADSAADEAAQVTWQYMEAICAADEKQLRAQLLACVGLERSAVSTEVSDFSSIVGGGPDPTLQTTVAADITTEQTDALFSSPKAQNLAEDMSQLSFDSPTVIETEAPTELVPGAEEHLKKALLVGDFAAAVDVAFAASQYDDALVLAHCGGQELLLRTQTRYLQRRSSERPFLKIVDAILGGSLEAFMQTSELSNWKETLAILLNYCSPEEFSKLADMLGDRLKAETGDCHTASLCYLCSRRFSKTLDHWLALADKKIPVEGSGEKLDTSALQEFVERVSVLRRIIGYTEGASAGPEGLGAAFARYSALLAAQGELQLATRYAAPTESGELLEAQILRDRLYHATPLSKRSGGAPPFPFQATPAPMPQAAPKRQQVPAQEPRLPQVVEQLAPGFQELFDASSQRHYYVNLATRVSQWEKPVVKVAAQPAAVPSPAPVAQMASPFAPQQSQSQPQPQQEPQRDVQPQAQPQAQLHAQQPQIMQPQIMQTQNQGQPQKHATEQHAFAHAATKGAQEREGPSYNDGFVSSSSRPEIAAKYGNAMPATGFANSSGGAVAAEMKPASTPATATATSTPTPTTEAENMGSTLCSPEHKGLSGDGAQVMELLNGVVSAVGGMTLGGLEKKQHQKVQKALAELEKRLSEDSVAPDVVAQILELGTALSQRNYAQAEQLQTTLANTVWNLHKAWLQGTKWLISMAKKHLH